MADKMLFTIGSALDNASGWSMEEEKKSVIIELKEPKAHRLVLKMEKRRGKPVSIVGPFFLSKERMSSVCAMLKKKLGSGGTCKDEWMEFQGECREKIKQYLQEDGFGFKS